ncbi:ABC transporter permease [Saccharomonospora iraqiensis]|uniref:ABC transporter permease n=1 Tax=Saccharomonospora iraqiensis TaxID=52698 RepID=UPI0012B57615|nr:ABC transporter permease [Saccharomonospora iraqiensis]
MTTTDALLPDARAVAARLGKVPGRNELKAELGIGSTRADRLRAALRAIESGSLPAAEAPEPAPAAEAPVASVPEPAPVSVTEPAPEPEPEATGDTEPGPDTGAAPVQRPRRPWALILLALPAFVAVWSGWVGLGSMTGFGVVHPLPGIADGFTVDTAITLPIGVETYAAYALSVWLSPGQPARARSFARASAIGALVLGAAGQVAYHLLEAAGAVAAPWPVTMAVACLPVAVLGAGAALAHLVREAE